jgi:DNA replication and repair protein RecF
MIFESQHISEIKIDYFKQYIQSKFEFHPKFNIITGNNGVGKTNLLDAIYYACFLKSNFSNSDNWVYNFQHQLLQVELNLFVNKHLHKINIQNLKEQKKQISLNDILIDKQTEIAGKYSIVFIEPYDQEIILGNADVRRKFIDATLCLSNPEYLLKLVAYQRILKQKNALLKQLQNQPSIDMQLLSIYNAKLSELNIYIYEHRINFLDYFNIIFKKYYTHIFDGNEAVALQYESKFLEQEISTFLNNKIKEEIQAQRCLYGIHTDDIQFYLNQQLAKKIASQGQQKTIVLALKLAQYEYIKKQTHKKPLLFLDDIFDKLDIDRIKCILELVNQEEFGQIFITYTDANRILSILHELNIQDYKHITLAN